MSVTPDNYEKEHHRQFVQDMIDAGLEPRHYKGRFFYEGPAVVVPFIEDAIKATDVECQWDNMGFERIVYPKD